MSLNSDNKENSIAVSTSLLESNNSSRSKITIEKISRRKSNKTTRVPSIDENNNNISSDADKKLEQDENELISVNEPNEVKLIAKRQALKSIQNILTSNKRELNEERTKKKADDSLTLFLTCTSDPIHDIILNNFRSSEIKIPPFQARFNLQCNSDDQVLSDNIDDLFTYKIIVEKDNPVLAALEKEDPQTNQTKAGSLETTLIQDLANNPNETSASTLANQSLSNDENIQPRSSPFTSSSFKRKFEPNDENETLQSVQPKESSFKKIRIHMFDNNDYLIVMNLIKKIFTVEEIRNSIFPDKFNASRSKNLVPFNQQKIEILKEEIAKHFNLDEDEKNEVWALIRPKLNVKIKCLRRTKAYSILN